jgi:hypothetical protein
MRKEALPRIATLLGLVFWMGIPASRAAGA